jgi:hypothetical protein
MNASRLAFRRLTGITSTTARTLDRLRSGPLRLIVRSRLTTEEIRFAHLTNNQHKADITSL